MVKTDFFLLVAILKIKIVLFSLTSLCYFVVDVAAYGYNSERESFAYKNMVYNLKKKQFCCPKLCKVFFSDRVGWKFQRVNSRNFFFDPTIRISSESFSACHYFFSHAHPAMNIDNWNLINILWLEASNMVTIYQQLALFSQIKKFTRQLLQKN